MARVPLSSRDPARDAAALLRRLGFAVLAFGVPVMSLLSRRGVVLMMPIGAALLIVAASLDRAGRRPADSADRLMSSAGTVALVFGFAWMAVSLAWSPDPAASAGRLGGLFGTLGLTLAAYVSLPERTRAANMYLVPVGIALAAAVAIGLAITTPPRSDFDEDGRSLGRGVTVLILFLWPAIAWLRSRTRDVEAACLTILVAVAAVLGPGVAAPVALIVGLLAFLVTSLSGRFGAALTGVLAVAGLASVPLLPFLPTGMRLAFGLPPGWSAQLEAWAGIVRADPWRLATGHGFGTLLPARLAGLVPASGPEVPLVQIWYELGVVGVLAAALALWMGLRGATASYHRLLPGIVGAVATAYALACLGVGAGQAWWPGALAILGLVFVAAERGQYRTRRPPRARHRGERARLIATLSKPSRVPVASPSPYSATGAIPARRRADMPDHTLDALNEAPSSAFVAALGGIFEHAPWVAAAAAGRRPFGSIAELFDAMRRVVLESNEEHRVSLLKGHPELAGAAAKSGNMTSDSVSEQTGAGLDRMPADRIAEFDRLNALYRERFGIPFIVCVRRHGTDSLLAEFRRRTALPPEMERETALAEVFRIAALRLDAQVAGPDRLPVVGRLSTHVLDTVSGLPAEGVAIDLVEIQAGGERRIASALTNVGGRTDAPLIGDRPIPIGTYELRFALGDHYRARGVALPDPAFLDVVPIRFGIAEPERHYHVPLTASPWSYSTYRGS